jgi:hypothetical protein
MDVYVTLPQGSKRHGYEQTSGGEFVGCELRMLICETCPGQDTDTISRYAMLAVLYIESRFCICYSPMHTLLAFSINSSTPASHTWSFSRISATTFLTRGSFACFSAADIAEGSCKMSLPASQKSLSKLSSVPVATRAR